VYKENDSPATVDAPTQAWVNTGGFNTAGYRGGQFNPATGPVTVTWKVQVPLAAAFGTNYRFYVGIDKYYQNVPGLQTSAGYMAVTVTTCLPQSGATNLQKRVEGTAENNQIMIYWLDYDFLNSTGNQVRDTVPGCLQIQDYSRNPDGSAPSLSGQTLTWTIPNADASSSPVRYRRTGSLFVQVSVGTGPDGACSGQVINTGEYRGTATSNAWLGSPVTQTLNQANVQLWKEQQDAGSNPIVTAQDGQQVTYILNYTLSGSGLKCFDSFNGYTAGQNYASPATPPGTWIYDADSPSGSWMIKEESPGDRHIQYQNSPSNYRTLLNDCSSAKMNGQDFCPGVSGIMVQSDVRIDGSSSNGDTGLVLRSNGLPGSAAQAYLLILSVDAFPSGNLMLQRNDNTSAVTCCTWPSGGAYTPPASQAPVRSVWYTIKMMEQPFGRFRAKYWKRGDPEPTNWMFDYTDPSPFPCSSASDSVTWRPGIAGQADVMSYDNFRVYSAMPLQNAHLVDTIPAGITYLAGSAQPTAQMLPGTMIGWDFTGNLNGAIGGLLFEGTGSVKWTGVVNCASSSPLNVGRLGAEVPDMTIDSNAVTLQVACVSPTVTFTPTETLSPTVTFSATSTYTPTLSSTPTATTSPTETRTPTLTPSATPTPTITSTRTATATPTQTKTPTQSPTITLTPTVTQTPTITPTLIPASFYLSRNVVHVGEVPPIYALYVIPESGRVALKIYNTAGELVRVLRDGYSEAGKEHRTAWDLRNENGEEVAAGVYIIQYIAPLKASTYKFIVLR